MLTMNEIKSLMSPLDHPAYVHSALLNPSEGKHAINLALLRWCGGAEQLSLTKYALPFDALGRSYILDVFIGEVVGVRYAFWSKVKNRKRRGKGSANNNRKGSYLTAPHITLDCLGGGRIHYRPFIHTLVAYVYPPLREQYAQAVMTDMVEHSRSFTDAIAQVNHIDKDIENNSAINLEVVTASANSQHKVLTVLGHPYSMICHSGKAPQALSDYYSSTITDNSSYVERMCRQLSNANLPVDTEKISISIKSITGNKLKTLDITGLSIWGILISLYTAMAHSIGIEELNVLAN